MKNLSELSLDTLVTKLIDLGVSLGSKLIIAVIIFFIGRWLVRKFTRMAVKIMEKKQVEPSLFSFVRSLISISLNFIVIIAIVGVLGIETSSFVALFASAGVAIGMALSGTLQNFAGGVMLLLFKPFKVNDFIEAQGQTGTVKEIQIFNTIMTTPDNKIIIIPNGGLSTGIMKNYSREETRRVDWEFGIGYGNSYEKAKEVLIKLLEEDTRILKEPEYFIALGSLGASSVNIVVRAWVQTPDYWPVFFEMNQKVYHTFDKEQLSIPFPQMDVHLYHKNKPADL